MNKIVKFVGLHVKLAWVFVAIAILSFALQHEWTAVYIAACALLVCFIDGALHEKNKL